MKIIIDSAALDAIAYEIEHSCLMLGLISDADDIEDLETYRQRIRRAGENLSSIIQKSEKVKV